MPPERYDLHIHSSYSDGSASIQEIADKSSKIGLDMIAIVDHFWPSFGSRRLGGRDINNRNQEIKQANSETPHMRILNGAELDISFDGNLTFVPGGIQQFELIIGSFHNGCNSSYWASAIKKAVEKAQFQILGHYDGYMSSYRKEDGELVASLLAEHRIAVELNRRYPPENLHFLEVAGDAGCYFTLGTDAHSVREIGRTNDLLKLVLAYNLTLLEDIREV
jgi:histidinol phosphatase-like PHP family hydrolase